MLGAYFSDGSHAGRLGYQISKCIGSDGQRKRAMREAYDECVRDLRARGLEGTCGIIVYNRQIAVRDNLRDIMYDKEITFSTHTQYRYRIVAARSGKWERLGDGGWINNLIGGNSDYNSDTKIARMPNT